MKVVELEAAEDDLDNIQQEIKMLQAFNCPQLTRYHGSFIVGSALWISMEYLEGGSLQDLIKSSTNNLDEHTAQWILREILKALVYLHLERKIHRDVKAGNILVASDGSVRLADFGESVQLTHSIAKRQTFAGSPYWMAPEVIMAQDTYNSKADIWSLGVTAIEMIKGRPPYSDMHPMKAVLCIPNNPPPTLGKEGNFSKHFHTFLEQCFQRDPNLRPSAQELLKHPFMKAAKRTDSLNKLLEARRASQMMKSLFGGGLLNSTEPPQDATHKAKPTTALPASAAAAIAAAAASKVDTTSGTPLGAATNDPKTLSVEWDFGDGDESFAEQARVAAAGLGDFDFASPVPQAAVAAAGEAWSGLGISAAAVVVSPPSPGAVTPKARHGSGGMWADGIAAAAGAAGEGEGGGYARKGPPPLAERHRNRGKMTKVGHVLGINDAAAAATLQKEMTVLTRMQDEEIIRRQKLGGLGSWKTSTKSAEATESQDPFPPPPPADPQGTLGQSWWWTPSFFSQEQHQPFSDSFSAKARGTRPFFSGWGSRTSSPTPAPSGEGGGGAEEKRSRLSRLRRHRSDKVRSSSSSSSSSRRARGGSGVSTSSAPRSHAGSHDLAAWEEGGGARGAPAAATAAAAVEALEGAAPAGEAVDEPGGGKSGATSEPGRGPSSSRNLGHSNGERPSSGGRGDGTRKGSPAAATEPRSSESASRPGPPADGGDNANKPDAEPDATAADGDGAAGGRRRRQGGGGDDIEGEEGKEEAAGEEAGTRRLPLPAPLVTKRSWEHDDVGDLFESVDGNGNDGAVLVAAEGAGGVDQAAAAAAGGEAGEARNAVGSEAGAVGGSQAASPSGVRPESAEAGDTARGEEGGVRSAGGRSSLPPAPPLGRALELDGRSEKDTPTSVPKSSLGMPWGSVVFRSSTSESPGANSMNSTAGVLGLGTSGELRDAEGGSVAVTDDYGGGGAEAQEEEGVRGWEEAGVGAAAAGCAALARVDSAAEADDDLASKAATGEEEEEPLQPLPEGAPTGGSGSADDDDDSGVVVPLPKGADGGVVVEEEVEEEEGATEALEAAAAETADAAEDEVRLTAAFHAHLTPALCEALERLDGCSDGQLTLDFVGAIGKSWSSAQASPDAPTTPTAE
ncbi:Serine/threonine protein kinase [Ectocarpus siliculosus]|uniref:Serine/threonine protein kinase n=1 Tax=Ectocarpus siliculosus TaxID=2880 RepID=D8LIZ0_ECTSI|nr:Serine/threonine protein kinase [Ectocarpus siliculosus]|eukprot:CBN76874.1 Serine/threonine protein kinase [Ectocarpus siliculosus]